MNPRLPMFVAAITLVLAAGIARAGPIPTTSDEARLYARNVTVETAPASSAVPRIATSTDEARALAGLRVNPPAPAPRVAFIPTTTDQARGLDVTRTPANRTQTLACTKCSCHSHG